MTISTYYLVPDLPEELQGLAQIALDLRWSWSHVSDYLWKRIDPDLWDLTRNPCMILQSVSTAKFKELAEDQSFRQEVQKQVEQYQQYFEQPNWFSKTYDKKNLTVAYFSMEFGLSEALPIYSGGLGILAGDMLKTASDLGVPVYGIGLLYQQGYFRQALDTQGRQMEFYPYNDPSQLPVLPVRDKDGEWLCVTVEFPGRKVRFRVWQAKVGRVMIYLLDSNHPENSPADQCIAAELYGGGAELRLQQEMALGIGGWRLLNKLGIDATICHLNEGHAALAVIERARMFMQKMNLPFEAALEATKSGNIFTTHTPVEAGFDRFSYTLVNQYLKGYTELLGISVDELMDIGRQKQGDKSEPLNMAFLAVRGSGSVNAVSGLHAQVSRKIFSSLFPRRPYDEIPITHITNGVHMPSWDSQLADKLWTQACGKERWLSTLERTEENLKKIADKDLWEFRNHKSRHLIGYVRKRLVRQKEASGNCLDIEIGKSFLDPDILTLGFAKRFTSYKRPNLLLQDRQRLSALLGNKDRPVRLIIAGKAHPKDVEGKAMIAEWSDFIRQANAHCHVIFLIDYDMLLAEQLVEGVDLWINTPRRPWEASGTSGMKVLVNGGLNLSELDGWWAEAYKPQVGWSLGDGAEHDSDPAYDTKEAEELYEILENQVVPEFYERDQNGIPVKWVTKMRTSMAELTPRFSSNRMLREYVERLYLPALSVFNEQISNNAVKAKSICHWKKVVKNNWSSIRFGQVELNANDSQYYFKVPLFFEGIDPENIAVQLYADPLDGRKAEVYKMKREGHFDEPQNGYFFEVSIPNRRNARDYTPRVVPVFEGMMVPMEANQILWKD